MLFSKQTPAAGGTAFAQFDAAWCYDGNGYILNDTGTSLDVRIGASGSVQTLASGATLPIKLVFSMAELYVRRTDQGTTQVTVEAQVGTGSAGGGTSAEVGVIAAAAAAAAVAGLGLGVPIAHTASGAALPGAHSNAGAVGAVTLTPTITAGARYSFAVLAAQALTVQAPAGVTIRVGASITAAAGSISSDVVGARIDLLALSATELVATSTVEVW